MRISRPTVVLAFATLLVAAIGLTWASDDHQSFQGKVTAVDTEANSFTVTNSAGNSMTFSLNEETIVVEGEEELDAASIVEDAQVAVQYKVVDGKNIALTVQILAENQ